MVTVESPAIEEGTKVSEHPEELLAIDYAILTNAIALPIIEKATVSDSSAPSSGANNNLVSSKKYNSDQNVDPENWEVISGNLAIHPYEDMAIRAVSSYQQSLIHIITHSSLGAVGTPWGRNNVLDSEILKEIAQAKGKTVAQVCLRWAYEQGISVVVKSFKKSRMKQNLEIFNWKFSQEDRAKIEQIPLKRGPPPLNYFLY
ncbi:hypothetical protein Droror1_Dr00026864 [Drosera rotundifolia]